jgi:hypothetical protein
VLSPFHVLRFDRIWHLEHYAALRFTIPILRAWVFFLKLWRRLCFIYLKSYLNFSAASQV